MKFYTLILAGFMILNPLSYPVSWAAAGHDEHGEEGGHEEEVSKGPHGGRLLRKDNVSLELTIFETGVPPEFRIYVYENDKPVPPTKAGIRVTLTRLGGKQDVFSFTPQSDYLRANMPVKEPHSFDVAVAANVGGKVYNWTYESYEGRTNISAASAKTSSLTTTVAGPGVLQETVTLNGTLGFHPAHMAKISARYPGVLRKLHVGLGDKVKAGQTLATVESNISLSSYAITSPVNGIVVEQNISVGETVGDIPLMVVANPTKLRATLQSFPSDGKRVQLGQSVILSTLGEEHAVDGTIDGVVPDPDSRTPLMLAIVNIDNSDGHWTAGSAVLGKVVVNEKQAPLVVKASGLQPFRDFTVVFAKVKDTYEVRMLELGLNDGIYAEVLAGLEEGEEYVSENSYLIKADIEKSGASHDH